MLEIFQYEFMQRAFWAGCIVAVLAPAIGMFVVVKRLSLISDTLSHVSLTGVALGLVLGFSPTLGALLVALAVSVGVEQLRFTKKIYGESVLSLFMSGGLALAVVILSVSSGINADLFSYLFGSITTVSRVDLWIMGALGLFVFLFIIVFYRQLFLLSLNEQLAAVGGVRVRLLNTLLIVLTAITVALSLRIVGALLIGALMIIPVITAMLYRRGFFETLVISVGCSFISVIGGLILSYYQDVAAGGAIVLWAIFLFLLSYFVTGSVAQMQK